jgi:hypothetical protein
VKKLLVTLVALLALAAPIAACSSGGGNISRSKALSELEKKASSPLQKKVAECIVSKVYDSGKFSDSEIQKIVKADNESDVGTDLAKRFEDDAVTPCASEVTGSTSS